VTSFRSTDLQTKLYGKMNLVEIRFVFSALQKNDRGFLKNKQENSQFHILSHYNLKTWKNSTLSKTPFLGIFSFTSFG